jgi:hypothetical protein
MAKDFPSTLSDTSNPKMRPRYAKELLALLAAFLAAAWGVKSYNAAAFSNQIAVAANNFAMSQAMLSNQLMLVSMCQANNSSVSCLSL